MTNQAEEYLANGLGVGLAIFVSGLSVVAAGWHPVAGGIVATIGFLVTVVCWGALWFVNAPRDASSE